MSTLPVLPRTTTHFVSGDPVAVRNVRHACSEAMLRDLYRVHVTQRNDQQHAQFALYVAMLVEQGHLRLPRGLDVKCRQGKELLMHTARSIAAVLEYHSFVKGQTLCRLGASGSSSYLHVFFLSGEVTVSTHQEEGDGEAVKKAKTDHKFDAFGMRVKLEKPSVQQVWKAASAQEPLSSALFYSSHASPHAVVAQSAKVETLCVQKRVLDLIARQVMDGMTVDRDLLLQFQVLRGAGEAARNKLAVMARKSFVGLAVNVVRSKTEASTVHFLARGECLLLLDVVGQQVPIVKTATSQQKSALHDIAQQLSSPAATPLCTIHAGQTFGDCGVFKSGRKVLNTYTVRTQSRCELISVSREAFVSCLSGLPLNVIKSRLTFRNNSRRGRHKHVLKQAHADQQRLQQSMLDPGVPDWQELTGEKVSLVAASNPLRSKGGLVHKVLSSVLTTAPVEPPPTPPSSSASGILKQRYDQLCAHISRTRLLGSMCVAPLSNQRTRVPRRLHEFAKFSQKRAMLPQDLSKSTGLSRRQKEHSRRTVLVSVKRHALGMEAVDLYPSAVKEKEIASLNRVAETPEEHAALKLHSPLAKRLARASRFKGRVLRQSKHDKLCYLNIPVAIKQPVTSRQVRAYLKQVRGMERGYFSAFGGDYRDVYRSMVVPVPPSSVNKKNKGGSFSARAHFAKDVTAHLAPSVSRLS